MAVRPANVLNRCANTVRETPATRASPSSVQRRAGSACMAPMARPICRSVSPWSHPLGSPLEATMNSRNTCTSIRCTRWADISAPPGCWTRNSEASWSRDHRNTCAWLDALGMLMMGGSTCMELSSGRDGNQFYTFGALFKPVDML